MGVIDEVDAAVALEQPIPPLLPFVPMLRGGNSQQVIRRAVSLLHQQAHAQGFEPLLGYFASLVVGPELAAQIVRLDMVVLEQSAFYWQLVARDRRRTILKQLERRFGSVPARVADALEQYTAEQLDDLMLAVVEVSSLDEFEARLNG